MAISTAVQITAVIAAVAVSLSASDQTARIQKACPIGDKPVMVEVREIPRLKQRCYEVAYETQRGYLCVWAGGTPDGKYGYTREFDPEKVTEQGWTGGGNVGCTAEACFKGLCSWLVRDRMRELNRMKFNPDEAGDALDAFFKPQTPPQTDRQSKE